MPVIQALVREWLGRVQSPTAGGEPPRLSIRNLTRDTTIGDSVDIADKGARRRKGLLDRSELRCGEGLWIVPCEAVHTFFMKFALDLVYLDRERNVVKVKTCVVPWRISMCLRAHSIIELPLGTIHSTGTQRGDRIQVVPVHGAHGAAS